MEKTKKARVIAFANQKGGVGKTMSVLNIGVGLVQRGYRVLLVDIDSQANLTMGCGFEPEELEFTLSQLLEKCLANENKITDFEKHILHTDEGIDLLPSDINLQRMEGQIFALPLGREFLIKRIIDDVKDRYDYILFDCPPSIGILTVNALVAADQVIIPSQAQIFSAKGSTQLVENIQMVRQFFNVNLTIYGILFTMIDKRSKNARNMIKKIEEAYGMHIPVFNFYIPQSVRVGESNNEGESIYKYDPKGRVAEAYRGCVEEIIDGIDEDREPSWVKEILNG